MPLDDLPLHHSRPTPPLGHPPIRQSGSGRWIVVVAAIVVASSLLAFWWILRSQPEPATPTPAASADASVSTAKRPKPQPLNLPELDASDPTLHDLMAALSRHPLIVKLLASPNLVRQVTLVVQQIGDGKTPSDPLRTLQPTSRLNILGNDQGRIDPKSYDRWNAATDALTSIEPADAAQLYVNTKGLFDAAYRELGHPTADFDEGIARAIQTLAATPTPVSEPELLRHADRPGYYEHVDGTLRSALPVQKQFLLIGPANRERVMAWLKRLAASLDIKID